MLLIAIIMHSIHHTVSLKNLFQQQIEEGIEFHKWRYNEAVSYLAYFQAYSNTYASLDTLKKLYAEALNHPGVIGLIIGTRPDCIDEEKLEYLKELSDKILYSH